MKKYHVYILTNKNNTVLYIGVTGDIKSRILQHKKGLIEGFSKRYNLVKLIYAEETFSVEEAIKREKQLKKWNRQWKIDLIKSVNPEFEDLSLNL